MISPGNAYDILAKGMRNREVGATRSNLQSSRSHLMITVKLFKDNKVIFDHDRTILLYVDINNVRVNGIGMESILSG